MAIYNSSVVKMAFSQMAYILCRLDLAKGQTWTAIDDEDTIIRFVEKHYWRRR